MPQSVEWLIEDRIILNRMWGDLTIEAINTNSDNGIAMCESVSHEMQVHTILDGRFIGKIPDMKDMLGLKYKRARNTGWIVMILSTNRVYKFMGSSFLQMMGVHFRIVETWGAAVEILANADSTLPDLSHFPRQMEHFSPLED